jgi:hypothetical protein
MILGTWEPTRRFLAFDLPTCFHSKRQSNHMVDGCGRGALGVKKLNSAMIVRESLITTPRNPHSDSADSEMTKEAPQD